MLGWFTRAYGRILRAGVGAAAAIGRPFRGWPAPLRLGFGLLFALVVTAISVGPNWWFVNRLEGEFLPEEDKGRMFSFVYTPEGSTTEFTDRQVRKMENILAKTPEVEVYGSVTAFALAGPGQANSSIIFIKLKDGKRRSVQEVVRGPGGLQSQFFMNVEGAFAAPIIPKAIGRAFGSAYQLVIQGQNLDELNEYTPDRAEQTAQLDQHHQCPEQL
jgi:multidrug efflux pump subunit AcrB